MTDLPQLVYLSSAAVRQALPMPDVIAAMRDAFVQLSAGQVFVPPRGRLGIPGQDSVLLLMPCHSAAQQRLSLKCVTVSPQNPGLGLPFIQALLILADAVTGTPLAIMDGTAVTSVRTGAASGLATNVLARQDASVVALFGAGAQSRTQLEAVCTVRRIRLARVFDIQPERAQRFADEMARQLGVTVVPADSSREALQDADVVCTATTACEPVFLDSDLPRGVHINAVGAFQAECAEVPPDTVRRAYVVVDQVDAALEEAGDLLLPLAAGLLDREHFATELGHVLSGAKPGRRGADEVTLFKSVGVAVQDLFAATVALENSRRMNLGVPLER